MPTRCQVGAAWRIENDLAASAYCLGAVPVHATGGIGNTISQIDLAVAQRQSVPDRHVAVRIHLQVPRQRHAVKGAAGAQIFRGAATGGCQRAACHRADDVDVPRRVVQRQRAAGIR